jgi:hypothetical protein
MRGVEDWFCTGRLRAASEDHRTSWKVFMAEVPGKLEGVKVLMEQVRLCLIPAAGCAHRFCFENEALPRPLLRCQLRGHAKRHTTDLCACARLSAPTASVVDRERAGTDPA